MITKTIKKSICGILAALILMTSIPMKSEASAVTAATYSAYQIISLIMAVCGGGVLHATQGILGDVTYDPAQMYGAMNGYRSGLGDILSSYVARGRYLAPGSVLRINEADFEAFKEYFQNNTVSEQISIGNATQESLNNIISEYAGFTAYVNSNVMSFISANEVDMVYFVENGGRPWVALMKRGSWEIVDNKYIRPSSPNYATQGGSSWTTLHPGVLWQISDGTLKWEMLNGSIAGKYNTAVKALSQAGKLDNISKTRRYNTATQEYEGDASIVMPRGQVLDEVLAQDDISGLYDAINAYPVNTADNTMALYPAVSATDYVVPEIAIDSNVSVQFPAIEGEAASYTMDLTSFFPFCIPFDIYAFLQAFEEDPEAPSITYNFPYLDQNGNVAYIEQTFNLSQFDGVAQLVRRLELVAFIVGLAFVTRSFFLRG